MVSFLLIFLNLFAVISLCKGTGVTFGPGHPIWTRHTDRDYRLRLIHPLLKKLLGADGLILEVGYEPYNFQVCKTANISCNRWYFVDVRDDTSFASSSGHLLVNSKGLSGLGAEWDHKFRVILDYGVVGCFGHKLDDGVVDEHVNSYSRLLEPGGFMLLKVDGYGPNKVFWPRLKEKISKHLILVHRHAQIHDSCPRERQIGFPQWDTTTGPEFSKELYEFAQSGCETNMYSQWYNPGNLYTLSK
jgi:hypothetical protein